MIQEGQTLFGYEECLHLPTEERRAQELGMRVVQWYKEEIPKRWQFWRKPNKVFTEYKIYTWKDGWFEVPVMYKKERVYSKKEMREWENGL